MIEQSSMGHDKISKARLCELVRDLMLADQVWDNMGNLRGLSVFDKGLQQTLDISIYMCCKR